MPLRPTRTRSASAAPTALVAALVAALLAGCAAMSKVRPEPPVVSVASVRPLNLSLSRQRLRFTLLVENPNGFELPLEGLDFVATLGDDRVARGSSDDAVTIPANGAAEVSVDVVAGIDTVMDRLRAMVRNRTLDLDYTVAGTVELANWPRKIPFDVEGIVDNPLRRSGEGDGDDGDDGGEGDAGDRPAPGAGADPGPADGTGEPLVPAR